VWKRKGLKISCKLFSEKDARTSWLVRSFHFSRLSHFSQLSQLSCLSTHLPVRIFWAISIHILYYLKSFSFFYTSFALVTKRKIFVSTVSLHSWSKNATHAHAFLTQPYSLFIKMHLLLGSHFTTQQQRKKPAASKKALLSRRVVLSSFSSLVFHLHKVHALKF